ncbi:MAG: VTT domain-containing protein [Kiloniellales bacterium]|nr:VTT domain-containing protein [Kiloniellales bacterium]
MFDYILEPAQIVLALASEEIYLAVAVYLVLHVSAALLFLPCSPFTFVAGAAWGLWPGLAISSLTALTAAALTFLIGRLVGAGRAGRILSNSTFVRKSSAALGRIVGTGWAAVVIVQGNPFVPASSAGYAFGFSGMRCSTFTFTTFLSTLPLQTALVASGAAAKDVIFLHDVREPIIYLMLVSTLALGVWLFLRRHIQADRVDEIKKQN